MQLKGNIIILVGEGVWGGWVGGMLVGGRETVGEWGVRDGRGGRIEEKGREEVEDRAHFSLSYRMAQALFLQSGVFSPLNSWSQMSDPGTPLLSN